MLTIQSLIQNAKQLSKSYEKNALNAEGLMQHVASFPNVNPESAAVSGQQPQSGDAPIPPRPAPSHSKDPKDPKEMIASLLEAEAESARQQTTAPGLSAISLGVTSSSTCRPRSLVMHAIQRESAQVRALKQENTSLKQQLAEYQFALELIMSKYRSQMMALLNQAEACCTTILSAHESPARLAQQAATIALSNRLEDMRHRFERTIGPSTEERLLAQRELLHQLVLEHATLGELYQISRKYGSTGKTGEQTAQESLMTALERLAASPTPTSSANSSCSAETTVEQGDKENEDPAQAKEEDGAQLREDDAQITGDDAQLTEEDTAMEVSTEN